MLFPKKIKFKKVHKNKTVGVEINVNKPLTGFYGIKATISGRITGQQIESVKKTMLKKMQKFGRLIIRIFPFLPVTSKPSETRMGKGKGSFSFWCSPIKPGRLIIEFQGTSYNTALIINKLVNSKLCLKTKLVKNI
jgi:large subunit ribosomal protein L16